MSEYYALDVEQTLAKLATSAEGGLTEAEAAQRQARYGKNSLPVDSGTNWVQLIVGQFSDLMIIILLVAAAISFFLGDAKDVVIILAIVILNAIIGVYQGYRAEKALAALSALQVPLVRVRRAGLVHEISAEDLVPGDVVLLQEGDRVPADGRLVRSVNLQADESALTGESVPVDKSVAAFSANGSVPLGDRSNMLFMGTAVNYGRGELVVTRTGLKTELGNIAAMLMQVEQGITPLQRRLNRLGQMLAVGAGVVVLVVFIAGVLRGGPAQQMFLTSISLAVAAVPEGLPALITISLSLGAARMIRRHVLIRRLPAVETLGSVTTICSDKTGTLTRNEMTATEIALPQHPGVNITGIGYVAEGVYRNYETGETLDIHSDPELARFVKASALSTNAFLERDSANGGLHVLGDTTEGALLVAAGKAGWTREYLERELPRVAELPFSSERKAMTTVHHLVGEEARALFMGADYIAITKGAPDQMVEWATHEMLADGPIPMTDKRRADWLAEINQMADRGLRVLGLAFRPLESEPEEVTPEIERNLYSLGLVGILDPARPEAGAAVARARAAGIRSIMITGDHALTAEAISRHLGILEPGERAVVGSQLDQMDDAELLEALRHTSTFARVSPQHKLRLVRLLQSQNEVVAMTGDGVNDAPALKQADIGVAMGITGTDVSKGAAAMVLTDDNFASIVSAVEEGRIIYDNIRKFIKYLLSSNVGEILVMFVALLVGFKLPLLAIQILWINLVTDGLPAIALGFEPAEPDVMQRKPRPRDESVLAGGIGRHIAWVGVLIATLTLGGYVWGYTSHNMDPFSPTLGLENLTRAELGEVVGPGAVPADWDALSVEQRVGRYLTNESGGTFTEEGDEGLVGAAERLPRTIAFTVLAITQMFEVMAIRAGDKASFFQIWFRRNRLLFFAVALTAVLQLAVIYVPFLQAAFDTAPLSLLELMAAFALASVVLFGVEIEKLLTRRRVPAAEAA